jgi:DNA-binding beta-propeller fold protein YncE
MRVSTQQHRRRFAAMMMALSLSSGFGVVVSLAAQKDVKETEEKPAVSSRIVRQGLTIDFEVEARDEAPASARRDLRKGDRGKRTGADRVLGVGDTVDIGFTIRDAGSGNPVSSLNPASWLALSATKGDEPRAACGDLVRSALGQSFLSQPALNLNAYYVLALNADATISVIDPLSGFGGTKLLAMVALQSPGADWALTADQDRLLVTMPGAGRVAAIDTRSWTVTANIDIGPPPSRVMLQPDEAYAWIAYEAGVVVLDVRMLKIVARIPTGRGPHQMAFSDDSRWAFITNGEDGSVSLVDVRSLNKVANIAIGSNVSSIAFSTRARAAYVTSPGAGTITGIDAASQRVITRIAAAPGVGAVAFAPDGRLGFAVNPSANTVSIFDASLNRIIRTADVEKAPDQLSFTSRFAYVRHGESEIVAMVPLDELRNAVGDAGSGASGDGHGKSGGVPLLDFPGGQRPFGHGSRASLAASIVRSADDNAVLVANPGDKAIYYYQEGMAAPMGQFSNYGREPMAVLVVDRSLREVRPGRYRSIARLPAAGRYNALLLINSPRVVHCFELSIAPALGPAAETEAITTRVESLTRETSVAPGTPVKIAFRITDGRTGAPVASARDAGVLIVSPGLWQARPPLAHEGDGVYTMTVSPPSPGLYSVFVTCPSREMDYRRVLTFEAVEDAK